MFPPSWLIFPPWSVFPVGPYIFTDQIFITLFRKGYIHDNPVKAWLCYVIFLAFRWGNSIMAGLPGQATKAQQGENDHGEKL